MSTTLIEIFLASGDLQRSLTPITLPLMLELVKVMVLFVSSADGSGSPAFIPLKLFKVVPEIVISLLL